MDLLREIAPEQRESPFLFTDSLIGEPEQRVNYTKEQLNNLMSNSISGSDFLAKNTDVDYLSGSLVIIDPNRIDLLHALNKSNPRNCFICISEELNLWYIDFSLPDNKFKEGYKKLLHKALEENVIIKIIEVYWDNDYYEMEDDLTHPGCLRKEDLPFPIYFIDHTQSYPAVKKFEPKAVENVKGSQLSQEEVKNAVKVQVKFRDANTIQLARYSQVRFWGDYGYRVDDQNVMAVVYEDDSIYFVGNNNDFEPLPIEEAFENHDVILATKYEPEFIINGKRGYFKSDDGMYYKVGSNECIPPEDIKTVEIREIKKND